MEAEALYLPSVINECSWSRSYWCRCVLIAHRMLTRMAQGQQELTLDSTRARQTLGGVKYSQLSVTVFITSVKEALLQRELMCYTANFNRKTPF